MPIIVFVLAGGIVPGHKAIAGGEMRISHHYMDQAQCCDRICSSRSMMYIYRQLRRGIMVPTIVMHPEENKLLVRRFYDEFLNTGDLDHAHELMDYNVKQHSMLDIPDTWPGFQLGMAPLYSAFPDIRYYIQEMAAQEDTVWVRSIVRGTHAGMFRGHPPTGKRFEIWQLDAYRLDGKRIIEHWDMVDLPGLYEQLGIEHSGSERDDMWTNEDA